VELNTQQQELNSLIGLEFGPTTFEETGEFQFFALGQRLLDALMKSLTNFNIKLLTKEQFLAVVELAFDNLVAPKLPPVLTPFFKKLVLMAAESLYDKLTGE
jgi:hypothetical protein